MTGTVFMTASFRVREAKYPIPVVDVVPSIFGQGEPPENFVVQELRLPRVACGVLVGVALAASGAVFQSLASNALASPDVIGIEAGASTAAVLMIVVVAGSPVSLSLAALAGALGTAGAIYALSYRRGISGYRLILVGIGIGATLSSVTSYLLTRAEIDEVQRAVVWLTGSLNGRTWGQVTLLASTIGALLPALVALTRGLRALQLGDDAARGIGVRVEPVRAALLVAAVGLAGFAVAAAGPILFVAFVSAPIARRMVGSGDVALLSAALVGALLLTVSDVVAREAFGSVQLPVGVITGILGAPYLLWLLARTNERGTGD
jgi:iron complex transport system permease protein